jgi:hypothetical protein
MLPLLAHSGRNDIALWVQWALTGTGGVGLGPMGAAFSYPDKGGGKEDEKEKGTPLQLFPTLNHVPKVNENFLREVKQRLTDVEGKMGNTFDGAESKYRAGDKESRVLVNALIAKVCFQLGLRRDCELAVETMEILTADMKHFTQNLDYVYVAIARRSRYDLEEMKVPAGSSAEGQAAKLLVLLGSAKNYLSAAEKTKDVHLLRDALKKAMNIYSDFSLLAYPDAPPKGHSETPGESWPPEMGTKEMLAAFTAAEVAEREKQDKIWLRRFGRIRAHQTLERIRSNTLSIT